MYFCRVFVNRYILIIVQVLFTLWVNAQFFEDFSGNESLEERGFVGNLDKFTIVNAQLRSNSEVVNDVFHISRSQNRVQNTEWEFFVDMQLNTSSANFVDICLVSNGPSPNVVNSGYLIRIGDTRDQVVFYKYSNSTRTNLLFGAEGVTEMTKIWLKVICNESGLWQVFTSFGEEKNYQKMGEVLDTSISNSEHFSFFIRQSTATFFQKHFFNQIYIGDIRVDSFPPKVLNSGVKSSNVVFFEVDEPIALPNPSQFSWRNGQIPSQVVLNHLICELTFAEPFPNGKHSLAIDGLSDLNGNLLDTIVLVDFFQPKKPYAGAIIFSEIYANENNSNGLPNAEYVELYNRSADTLTLEKCKFSKGGTPAIFPEVILLPGDYLIVCKNGVQDDFRPFGKVQHVTSFPVLNNSGIDLYLHTENDVLIDSVFYSDLWYRDNTKSNGGWSLERISLDPLLCDDAANWIASIDQTGGTPGSKNSVDGQKFDVTPPSVLGFTLVNPKQIEVRFSKSVSRDFLLESNFLIENIAIDSIGFNVKSDVCQIFLKQSLLVKNIYRLTIQPPFDCLGNILDSEVEISIAIPEKPEKGDLLFNELLPDPKVNGVSFIEIYNISDKNIDLSQLKLARWLNGQRQNFSSISSTGRLILPGEYIVIGQQLEKLLLDYPKAKSIQFYEGRIPTMPNSSGNLILFNEDDEEIDSVVYDSKMHFGLLSSTKGVSLERRSWNSPTLERNNWGSASASENFATPGYKNSQATPTAENQGAFYLVSKVMSPDGDGFEDALTFGWNLELEEIALNAYIYDLGGRMIQQILNNFSIPASGEQSWDGVLKNGSKIPIGNYILYLSGFNLNGQAVEKKMAFGVYQSW